MLTRKIVEFYTGKRVFTKIEAGIKKLSHNESRESSKRDRQISTMHQEQHIIRSVLTSWTTFVQERIHENEV